MKKTLLLLVFAVNCLGPVISQKAITLEDCFQFFKFYPQTGGGFRYLNDGVHYTELEDNGLKISDVRNPDFDSLLALPLPAGVERWDGYEFSADESRLLLRTGTEPVYRHSVLANYFVHDLKTRQTTALVEGVKAQFAAFSPDGSKVAFVADNNLFFKDLSTGFIKQITSDGAKNKVINGLPDWVYEEEFSPVAADGMVATKWSPDGKKIAFLRFDESAVKEFPLTWYEGGMYPRRTAFKYPKVGEANSTVSVHYYEIETGETARPDIKIAPDDYLVRLNWTPANELIVTRLNRPQTELDLFLIEPKWKKVYLEKGWSLVEPLVSERDAAYVDMEIADRLVFLDDAQHFLWASERSGFAHFYLYDMDGKVVRQLTQGDFDVTAFYGVDEKNGKFYYQTATPTPLDRQVWEGSLAGGAPRLLTPDRGTNDAEFSPTFEFWTHTWSDANTPPVVKVRNRAGEVLQTLADNKRVRELRAEYGFSNVEFWQFKLPDGTDLNGWMLKPPGMEPGKKYPVLFDNYGGPGSQTVQNQYNGYMGSWHQMLAQKGYIIVSLDNRGTGARGAAFKKCTQMNLGKLETEDQIAAARYLGTLPFVDAGRIGIWGWSFGGYLSTSCILKGADVFKMAMAVAPVTNWKWYDSAYTERYMGTTATNSAGYENNSPVNFADKLRGGNYLICHGIADDNVHWQQTTEMINALVKANKQFETYYYPNRNHGIYGQNATRHLFTKLTNFVLEKL